MSGPIPPQNGGTGVSNSSNLTITGGTPEIVVPSGNHILRFPDCGGTSYMAAVRFSDTTGVALVGGTKTILAPGIATTDIVIPIPKTFGGTPGIVGVASISANTSFTLTSSSGTDTSTYGYVVLRVT